MLIEWKKEYEIGIKTIDEQHSGLVNVMNRLNEKIDTNEFSDSEVITSLLDDLVEYTKNHFGFEERYMEEFDFEYKDEHKKAHNSFVEKVIELTKKYEEDNVETCFELIDYLEDWFITHVTGEDRRYVDLFLSKGIK